MAKTQKPASTGAKRPARPARRTGPGPSAARAAGGEPPFPKNPLWGGRFEGGSHDAMAAINPSIDFDRHLYAEDIRASRAHCAMLVRQKIIPEADGGAILAGLDTVLAEIEAGTFTFSRSLEDIHMNVEARLAALIGDAAGRLHTARSRNDQVATDFRLWVRETLDRIDRQLRDLTLALIDRAEEYADAAMPGFTHLQTAQPVTFGHHLLAYVEMFSRDRGRIRDARARMNQSPLGAAALAGTGFPIDRTMTAEALGFDAPMANSLDAVSDRDFALEALAAFSIVALHLSRFAEEIVLWSSAPFSFVTLSDAFSTGSSIMPQKRNPDAAELVRGKTGRVLGAFTALAVALKGLPLAYSKDMQEDKEPVFDAAGTVSVCLAAATGMVRDLSANRARMREEAGRAYANATDLADWLVRELGLPFRRAHHVTGALVKLAEKKGVDLAALDLADMRAVEPRMNKGVYDVLSVEKSIASRTSFGGTAPKNVRQALKRARQRAMKP